MWKPVTVQQPPCGDRHDLRRLDQVGLSDVID
jgi:hypothetical protein